MEPGTLCNPEVTGLARSGAASALESHPVFSDRWQSRRWRLQYGQQIFRRAGPGH